MTDPKVPATYSSTFPVEPPPDLEDPAIIAAHDQAAFEAIDRMLCHWDRPHRTSIHWILAIGEHPEAVALAKRCQEHLPTDGFDLIPSRWLHLTIRKLGDADELSAEDIEHAFTAAETAVEAIEPFALTLIPLAGSPGAVRFTVAPWQPLLDLYDRLQAGRPGATGRAMDVFRPHVGIAYSARQQPHGDALEATQRATHVETPVSVPVAEVLLVRMSRAAGWYEWNELARVRLK